MLRYVWKIEPVASMTDDELLDMMGPTIQRYIEADFNAEKAAG
jgi:Tetracyclin repressor-like, C-terminal domain